MKLLNSETKKFLRNTLKSIGALESEYNFYIENYISTFDTQNIEKIKIKLYQNEKKFINMYKKMLRNLKLSNDSEKNQELIVDNYLDLLDYTINLLGVK